MVNRPHPVRALPLALAALLLLPPDSGAEIFYIGHSWCERPVVAPAAKRDYRRNTVPRTFRTDRYRARDFLSQYLIQEGPPGFHPPDIASRPLWYELQVAIDYHTGDYRHAQDSPFLSATTDEGRARGAAEDKGLGEVLVVKVPHDKVCDRETWKDFVTRSGERVTDANHPVFQRCSVFETNKVDEKEWVFFVDIEGKATLLRQYPWPEDGDFPWDACREGGWDRQSGGRTRLRGRRAESSTRRASSSSTAQGGGSWRLRLGGVDVDLQTLGSALLDLLKGWFKASLQAKAEEVQGQMEAAARGTVQQVYDDFLYWLNVRVHDELKAQGVDYPIDTKKFEDQLIAWIDSPRNEIGRYVEIYLRERSDTVAWLLDAYREQESRQILSGFKAIYDDAKDKLDRFTRASEDIAAHPDTPYADILQKYGFSGEWVARFESYEGRFNSLDERYHVVEAVQIMVAAFQTDEPSEKIVGMLQLVELVGGAAEKSNIPIVSFFGQIVRTYAQVGKEMIQKVKGLGEILRARQGNCLGTGTTTDARNKAFDMQFGRERGLLVCPSLVSKDIYESVEPEQGLVFFWTGKTFVEGRSIGGGIPGALAAKDLIAAAAAVGKGRLARYRGKEDDVATIASVYNTPYEREGYGTGVPGLMKEARETIHGIADRLAELEAGLDTVGEFACPVEDLHAEIEHETGFRPAEFQAAGSAQELTIAYAIGYVEGRRGAYATYSKAWESVRPLSLVRVHGKVRDASAPDAKCPRCGGARLSVQPTGAVQVQGCEVSTADRFGGFVAHLITSVPSFEAAFAASVEGSTSAPAEIRSSLMDIRSVPFDNRVEWLTLKVPLEKAQGPAGDEEEQGEGEAAGSGPMGDLQEAAQRAEGARARVEDACRRAGVAAEAAESEVDGLEAGASSLQARVGSLRERAAGAARAAERAGILADAIQRDALAAIEAKQRAEKAALSSCEKAEAVQDSPADRNALVAASEHAASEAAEAAQQSREAFSRVRGAMEEAAGLRRDADGLAESLDAAAASINDLRTGLASLGSSLDAAKGLVAQAREASASLRSERDRAASLYQEARRAAAARRDDPDAAAEQRGAEEAYGRISAAVEAVGGCEVAAEGAIAMAEAQKDRLAASMDALSASMDEARGAAPGGESLAGIGSTIEDASAQADTAGIYAEAAEDAASKASFCAGIARDRAKARLTVEVPSVLGMTFPDARATLEAAGFVAGDPVAGDPAPTSDLDYHVQSQDPVPGSQAHPGSSVSVRIHSEHVAEPVRVDCSRWPGSVPTPSGEDGSASCDCPAGTEWTPDHTACRPTPAAQVAAAQCGYPGSEPRWVAERGEVRCFCKPGLEWNADRTACQPDRDTLVASAGCDRLPGSEAYWDEAQGAAGCRCPQGWRWNRRRTRCVVDKQAQVASARCDYPNSEPRWSPKDGEARCYCIAGYQWNTDMTACQPIPPQQNPWGNQSGTSPVCAMIVGVMEGLVNSGRGQDALNLYTTAKSSGCNDPRLETLVQRARAAGAGGGGQGGGQAGGGTQTLNCQNAGWYFFAFDPVRQTFSCTCPGWTWNNATKKCVQTGTQHPPDESHHCPEGTRLVYNASRTESMCCPYGQVYVDQPLGQDYCGRP